MNWWLIVTIIMLNGNSVMYDLRTDGELDCYKDMVEVTLRLEEEGEKKPIKEFHVLCEERPIVVKKK